MPGVTEITSSAEFDSLLSSLPPTRLLVLDFHATWCGPCKFIAPVVSRMADSYADVTFAKIDVDQVKDLARRYKVSAMPTFKLIKGGEVVDTLRGANAKALVGMVAKHSGRDAEAPKAGEEVKIDDLAPSGQPPAVLRLLMFAVVGYVMWNWWQGK